MVGRRDTRRQARQVADVRRAMIDDLVALADLNYDEANRELTRRAGGVVLDEDGLTCFAGAHWLPVLMNGVVRTRPDVAPAAVLERARRFFTARDRGFSVILHGEQDRDLAAACEASGL